MQERGYIERPKYLAQIEKFINKPVIKILTGMRRVGKSTILMMIKDEILKDIPDEQKIYMNFESLEYFKVNNALQVSECITERAGSASGKMYYFFDEIQLVTGWEKVINGLRVDQDCEFLEIFVTEELSKEELFERFLRLGGMPFLKYFNLEENSSYKYLQDVYHTVLVKDVLNYNKIRDVDIFNRILLYVMQNVGTTFSASSIKKYFRSESREVSVDTILNYLEYCCQAFILKKVPRFDTVGKRNLKVEEKYHLTDHGFRQAKGYSNTRDIERTLENIVYIELISRGYRVEIGKVMDREIDFIATKDKRRLYFQVSYLMETEETRKREFGVYNHIRDHYPKFVLSMDHIDFSQDGIIRMNVIDFLLAQAI